MIEHIHQLLQLGYNTTVVLYPFKETLTVVEDNIMSLGNEPAQKASFTATCSITNKGNTLTEKFAKTQDDDYSDNGRTWETKMKEKGRETQSLLVVNSYIDELYKLYQKGDERSEIEEKRRITLMGSFSGVIRQAVEREDNNKFNYSKKSKKNKNKNKRHYVILLPTEWSDEAAKEIFLHVFIRAGLITKDDPSCKLIFADKLHAIIFSFQKYLYNISNKYWLEYGILKKNKHYVVFEVDFEYYSYEASINCFLFQTGNTNSMINGIEVVKPYNMAKLKKIDLVSIKDIRKGLRKLLFGESFLPPAYSKNRRKKLDLKADKLLEKMIEITIAYYMNSKKNENDLLISKDYQSSSSQMSLQYPFKNLDFSNYDIDFNTDLMEKISMNDLYDIFFRDNEINIRSYIKKCLSQYSSTTIQGAMLVYRKAFETDSHLVYLHNDATFNYFEKIDEYRKYFAASHRKPGGNVVVVDQCSPPIYMNKNYIVGSISRIISSCTEKYFSSIATDTVEKLRYFEYNDTALAEDLLLKTKDDVKKAINLLPPSVIQYPQSKYNSMLESTENSYPSHIVNIDLSLQRCKYSFVQINKHLNDDTKIYGGNESESIGFPSLDSFITIKFLDGDHTNAFLHISQETFDKMLDLIARSTHLQDVFKFFAKYDRSKMYLTLDQPFVYKEPNRYKTGRNYTKHSSWRYDSFPPKESALMLPMIEELFENHDINSKKNLVPVYHQSYIMIFMVMYLIYLQYKIDIYLKENYKSVLGEISYVVSVDRILLDKCLMGSKSILKELLLSSGMTSTSRICKQLRVITQGEYLFSVLQQKANLDLPLKSYYIHAQLCENSIQMSLYQVVVKGSLESAPTTIVIKNNTIPIKHMHELLFDNLWNQIQSNCHQSLCEKEEHQANKNKNFEEREYSMADRLKFEESFMQYVKEMPPFKKSSTEPKNLMIPSDDDNSFCNCSIYLTLDDIVELSIKPVLKAIVSSILGTLTNGQVFGEYYISALFVTFDSILDSIFHRSYKESLESILEKTIKIGLQVKRLELPYFVLLNTDNSSSVNNTKIHTFNSLFTDGSLLQVSSAMYFLRIKDYSKSAEPKVYKRHSKTSVQNPVSINYSVILERWRDDHNLFEKGGVKTTLYFLLADRSQSLRFDLFKVDKVDESKLFQSSSTADDPIYGDQQEFNPILVFSFDYRLAGVYKYNVNNMYMPLYISIKPLSYQSLIHMSFEFGDSFKLGDNSSPNSISIGDRLTLKNTQYKKEENSTTN